MTKLKKQTKKVEEPEQAAVEEPKNHAKTREEMLKENPNLRLPK